MASTLWFDHPIPKTNYLCLLQIKNVRNIVWEFSIRKIPRMFLKPFSRRDTTIWKHVRDLRVHYSLQQSLSLL